METFWIILGALAIIGSVLWFIIKWAFIWWAVGTGCKLAGNHLILQSQKLAENERQNQADDNQADVFQGRAPQEHGRHISEWNGTFGETESESEPLSHSVKGIFTVIPGGKR
jgi:hypothetical protein